jgi:hypothetical protein
MPEMGLHQITLRLDGIDVRSEHRIEKCSELVTHHSMKIICRQLAWQVELFQRRGCTIPVLRTVEQCKRAREIEVIIDRDETRSKRRYGLTRSLKTEE